jgi:hypothetical protein
MTSSREDERVMEILAAARRRPAGEREAYLQSACAGDEDLRREGRAQPVDATLACSLLAGVSKPKVFRGR